MMLLLLLFTTAAAIDPSPPNPADTAKTGGVLHVNM